MNDEFNVMEESIPTEPTTEPVSPVAPTNVAATTNDFERSATLTWDHPASTGITYKVYVNDVFAEISASNKTSILTDLIVSETYKVNIKAVDDTTNLESVFSNEVYLQINDVPGANNPANWIGVRLDNIAVIYKK